MRSFWHQFHLHFLPLLIITFIFFRFFPLSTYATGINCEDNQVVIDHGRIVVVQRFSDLPSDITPDQIENGFTNAQIAVSFVKDSLKYLGHMGFLETLKNIFTTNPEIAYSSNVKILDNNQAVATYTIDDPRYLDIILQATEISHNIPLNIYFKFSGTINHGDKITSASCNIDLTDDDIDALIHKNSTAPKNACPGGCPDGKTCQFVGSNPQQINSPDNWECRVDSLSRVNVHGSCGDEAIDTAIGCIPLNTRDFTKTIITYAIGLAGFTALVIMLIASILILTGGSNPEQVKKGKEIFTSAIMGLLFIIFSAVILKIINQDILGNPTQIESPQSIDFNNQQSPYSDTIRNIKQQQGGSL